MVSLELALRLKEFGLEWTPHLHDFFSIPNTALEDRLFVVSDMMIDVQRLYGQQMITFNGAVEWSLDYITIAEALWRPSESQIRSMLVERLKGKSASKITLDCSEHRCLCILTYDGKPLEFEANSASDAYARAYIFMLKESNGRA
ncbi:MAG: hypothetical protein ACK2T3_04630 [Candidatus Promineifilaceae bacterium]|jgi:hypothetical protein